MKVAAVWLWQKRMGEAMEKPAFANAFRAKVAGVIDAPIQAPVKVAADRAVISDLSAQIATVDKKAAAEPDLEKRATLMRVRDNFQRRLNAYVMGE